jgi:hypothetical protein
MRWTGRVARVVERRDAYRVLVGQPEGRRTLGRRRHRWECNIKNGSLKKRLVDVGCIDLFQERD